MQDNIQVAYNLLKSLPFLIAENSNELSDVWSCDTEYITIVLRKSNIKKCRFLIISLNLRHTVNFSLVRRFGVAACFIMVV
jgi:hypothetical protein